MSGADLAVGIKLTPMRDPWPEMDICVGGVDKGSALHRFLRSGSGDVNVSRREMKIHVSLSALLVKT